MTERSESIPTSESEAALRASMMLAVAATGLGMFDWDLRNDQVSVNARFREMLGLPPGDVIGAAMLGGVVHPDDRELVRATIAGAMTPGSSGAYRFEHRALTPHGERWLLTLGQVQFEGEGEARRAVRIIGNDLDITEQKRSERELQESDERKGFLLALSDQLRGLTDAEAIAGATAEALGKYLRVARCWYGVSDSAGEWFYVARDWTDGTLDSLQGRLRLQDFRGLIETFNLGRTVVVEDSRTDARTLDSQNAFDGMGLIRALIAVPLLKLGKRPAGFGVHDTRPRTWSQHEIALINEVAERTWEAIERAHAEAELREVLATANEARALAESANRAKDEFLATLSHELRTPLAAILLWAGALRSGAMPPSELGGALDAILESAKSQSRLIEDLLDLTRLISGKFVLTATSTDVAEVVAAAIETVKPIAHAKRITLRQELEANLGRVLLDSARLKQVLLNLLSNAIKFTPKGGAVEVRVRKHNDTLELAVTDNGEGITPELMPQLFERFRQGDMGQTRQHMGLGIGLALSRQLVELQDGTISAHSDGRGRGATFRVRLPWRPLTLSDALDALRTPAALPLPLRAIRVLLIEDDAHSQEAMRRILAHAGAEVLVAASGTEALTLLDGQSEPDVILSDLGLPLLSGFELITRVASRYGAKGRPPPPSCAVSAYARDSDRKRAIDAGFDLHVTKPITPEQLVELVLDLRDIGRSVVERNLDHAT
ncbi:MAG TPA: ATP-binding protein [Polyangiaceae bacterium]